MGGKWWRQLVPRPAVRAFRRVIRRELEIARRGQVAPGAAGLDAGTRVLDFGCGGALVAHWNRYADVVDVVPEAFSFHQSAVVLRRRAGPTEGDR